MKKKLVYGIAAFHLSLVAAVVFHLLDEKYENTIWEKPLAILCSVNYSVWRFGFFSPDVGKSSEVEIMVHRANGDTTVYSTLKDFDFFLNNKDLASRIYGFKVYTANDTLLQDLCARSVATRLMNLHPDAWRIDYTMRSIRYPTMAGYRNKQAIEVKEIYSTSFELRPQ